MDQALIALITQIVLGAASFLTLIFKYRELGEFLWKVANWLVIPIKCFMRWIKLARKLEKDMAENKDDVASGRKEIDDVRKSIAELTSFVKEKLSPNGGSSAVDAIKRIENRQITYENRQLALLNDTKYGVFFCTTLGFNTWVNRTYARFLGCGTNELNGFAWRRFIRTEELARYSKIWESAFRDGCEFEDTVEFIDAHGGRVSLHISVSAVQNEKGETVSYIGQVIAL
jgi:PAS domain S-box-containing protein